MSIGSFVEISGYSRDELLKMPDPVGSLFAPDERDRVQTHAAARLSGQDAPVEYRALGIRKGGAEVILSLSVAPVDLSDLRVLQGSVEDITERVQAEETLRESEEQFRQFFENAPEYCYMVTPEGEIRDVNRAALITLGYEKEELVGQRLSKVYAPESLQRMEQLFARWEETGELRDEEMLVVTKKGARRTVLLSARAVRDAGGKVLTSVSVQKDITERMRAEEALRESELKFRSVIEQSSDGVTLVDEQGKVVEWNRGMEQITGVKRSETLGQPFWDVQFRFTPDERRSPAAYERIRSAALDFLKTGQSTWANGILEQELQRPDGTIRIMRASIFPIETERGIWIGSISRDVTERVRAEEALQESETRFRTLSDATFEGIAFTGRGIVVDVNQQMAEMLGYEIDELRGLDVSQFVAPEDRELVREKILTGVAWPYEHRALCKDGSVIFVEARARMMEIQGRMTRVTAVRDISEHKKAEMALQQERDRAQKYLDVAGAILVVLDPAGDVTLINQRGCGVLGYEEREILGKNWFDHFLPQAAIDAVKPVFYQLVKGTIEPVEYFENAVRTRSGEERIISWHNTVLTDQEGNAIGTLSSGNDITERVQAEEALRASERRYRNIIESIPVGMHLYELEPDGRLVFAGANPAADEILGVDNEQFVGQTIEQAFPPLVETEVPDRYRAAALQGKAWYVEQITYEEDQIAGAYEVHAFQTSLGRMAAAFTEITERKQAAEAQRRHAEFLRVLHEMDQAILAAQSPEAVARVAVAQIRQLIPCQRAIVVLYGLAANEMEVLAVDVDTETEVGEGWRLPPEPYANVIETIEQGRVALWGTREVRDAAVERIHQEGARSFATVPLIAQGALIGALNLGFAESDPSTVFGGEHEEIALQVAAVLALAIQQAHLHEQVRAGGERLRQLAQQVVTAQEEERRRLSRELHDESGQALTALKIGLDLIRLDLPQEAASLRQRLFEAVALTEATMDQIRLLAQDLRPPALDAIGLNPTLDGFCQDFGERTQLSVRYSSAELPLLSDAVNISLYRFLQEALTNAAKHASADRIEVVLGYDGGTVSLLVEDDGEGFAIQAATADPNRSGGIGLLGMQERIELLGGRLAIDSQPGRGTRIVAQIPWEEVV